MLTASSVMSAGPPVLLPDAYGLPFLAILAVLLIGVPVLVMAVMYGVVRLAVRHEVHRNTPQGVPPLAGTSRSNSN